MIKYLLVIAVGTVLITSAKADGGYHWVRPHYDHNGVFYNGHMQGNPDGNPYNNLGYPGNSYPYNPY